MNISWNVYGALIHDLVTMIETAELPAYYQLLAIGRGGYTPGVAISHLLKRQLYTFDVKTYTPANSLGEVHVTSELPIERKNNHVLLIDDLIDSGSTINFVKSLFDSSTELKIAVLINKFKHVPHEVDFTALSVSTSDWLIFPYEY